MPGLSRLVHDLTEYGFPLPGADPGIVIDQVASWLDVSKEEVGNLEDRIRAHVLLCWLALLLIRIIENTTGATWNRLSAELGRLHLITYTGPAGTFAQRTELTLAQRDIYTTLELIQPKKIIEIAAPTA